MPSEDLEFITFNNYNMNTKKRLFIIYSHTNKGKIDSCISKFTDIKDIYHYIVKRYKDQSDDVVSRKVGNFDGDFNYVIIRQTTEYRNYISWKDYCVYSPDENEIQKLRDLIYDTKF